MSAKTTPFTVKRTHANHLDYLADVDSPAAVRTMHAIAKRDAIQYRKQQAAQRRAIRRAIAQESN